MLYDEDFINGLPNPEEAWKSPLVVYVVKEVSEQHKQLKRYIEKWYEVIEEVKKSSYYSRLRSLDDKIFIAQIFEFFVADFCKSFGEVEFDPTLENGKTPELLWKYQDKECLLDVVTLFDKKDKYDSNRAINDLLNHLGDINHFYNIGVKYDNINIRELKKSKIKRKLIEYLDNLEYENIEPDEELTIPG